jgi:hypothetical protein
VADKAVRVANFQRETVRALAELVAAAGLEHPSQLRPEHLLRRAAPDRVVSFADLYRFLEPGELIDGTDHPRFQAAWDMARADRFAPASAGTANLVAAGGVGRLNLPFPGVAPRPQGAAIVGAVIEGS